MEAKMKKKRRAFVNEDDCVACGCCVKVCPRNAIEVWKGIYLHGLGFFVSSFHCQRNERILQPLLRAGTAIWNTGRTLRTLPQSRYSEMDEE